MEKGTIPVQFKGRSLAEINLDADLEYAEENDGKCQIVFTLQISRFVVTDDEDGVVQLEENIHATLEESEECINVGQEKKEVNANRGKAWFLKRGSKSTRVLCLAVNPFF